MPKLGVCVYPTNLSLEQILSFTREFGIQAVTLYAAQLPYAAALKDEGYTVGCFLPWKSDAGIDLSHVDYVFIGDEVNLDTHVHQCTLPAEYFYSAKTTVESIRKRYQGRVICAALGCIPPWWGFGKWFAKVDTAYLRALKSLGAERVFDGFGVNPFETSFLTAERELKAIFPRHPIYCAGFGFENLAFDSRLRLRLGGWQRRLKQLNRTSIEVASIWCLRSYENGQRGLVHPNGVRTFSGERFSAG